VTQVWLDYCNWLSIKASTNCATSPLLKALNPNSERKALQLLVSINSERSAKESADPPNHGWKAFQRVAGFGIF
jgi:hypothetical protein